MNRPIKDNLISVAAYNDCDGGPEFESKFWITVSARNIKELREVADAMEEYYLKNSLEDAI